MKQTIGKKRWKVQWASYIVWKFCELWSTNGLKWDQSSHPPFVNSALCFPRVAHGDRTQPNVAKREEINGAYANRIRWRHIVNVNVTIEIRSLISEAPKHFKLAMASRRAAFSGNTLLIATFSSLLLFFKTATVFMIYKEYQWLSSLLCFSRYCFTARSYAERNLCYIDFVRLSVRRSVRHTPLLCQNR